MHGVEATRVWVLGVIFFIFVCELNSTRYICHSAENPISDVAVLWFSIREWEKERKSFVFFPHPKCKYIRHKKVNHIREQKLNTASEQMEKKRKIHDSRRHITLASPPCASPSLGTARALFSSVLSHVQLHFVHLRNAAAQIYSRNENMPLYFWRGSKWENH